MYDENYIWYDGEHSVIIGEKDSWKDWHLIPSSRPTIVMPSQKTNYVDIVGADSQIDLSNVLTGYPTFDDREGELSFIIANGYSDYYELYSEIANYVNGREHTLLLKDNPEWVYEGVFSMSSESGEANSSITIGYKLKPYKRYLLPASLEHPDVFKKKAFNTDNFEDYTEDISQYFDIAPTVPSIVIYGDQRMTVKYWNSDYNISDEVEISPGLHIEPRIVFGKTTNDASIGFQVKGQGSIAVDFTRGRL